MQEKCNTPTPISTELTQLRELQSIGQLLVAVGGFVAFLSIRRQIPLLAAQAQMVQALNQRIQVLERRAGICPADRPY